MSNANSGVQFPQHAVPPAVSPPHCSSSTPYQFPNIEQLIFIFFLFFILRRYKFLIYKFTNSTMNIN